ncbi:DMT family transporter [Roseivirga sp.]|uniref:DMT family transporter n=1 Tax=Roseivirga sp. TaxID=1964215 RepID=UPI003B8CDE76
MNERTYGNTHLFVIPAIIWGSTWYVITFQLGKVDPLLSVAYRFLGGAFILFTYCFIKKKPLKYSWKEHARIGLQGSLLFGINYWLVYQSESLINSGLVAVAFSTIIFFNMIFGAIFLKLKIVSKVISGALLGLVGTIIIFKDELQSIDASGDTMTGILLCFLGVASASLGNIVSASNSKMKIPVIQSTAYGMGYGGLMMLAIALGLGKEFAFDTSLEYVLSLSYLTIFGSIIAFVTYLTLISKIGPDRAAYAIVLLPLIAVTISTLLEGFNFTVYTALGMLLLLLGNYFALAKKGK